MNRIRLLPEQVANQIAAGEVVERPASVVKELVENALDAQATRITVEIQAGGRSLIRVTDDGVGMSRDDALLSLERHATSKIARAEDLAAITTLGFRGEALPSIASVSRLVLTTREREGGPAATQIVVHGGRIVSVQEAGSPPGTTVEVRHLFFNLPARRKFLRSEETEYAYVQHYLTLAALAFPEVAFTFVRDGRLVWQLPALPAAQDWEARLAALRERMRGIFGGEREWLAVCHTSAPDATGEGAGPESGTAGRERGGVMRLWGFIGKPGVSRATREDQHLFVNRRPVENRTLNYALVEGYHTALMKGRYPVCCLFLELDPASVDVNIHPTKREVKFHNDRAVRQLVTEAIRQTLMRFHAGPERRWTPPPSPSTLPPPGAPPAPLPTPAELPSFTALTGTGLDTAAGSLTRTAPPPTAPPPQTSKASERLPGTAAGAAVVAAPSNQAITPIPSGSAQTQPGTTPTAPLPSPTEPVPLLQVPLRMLGVIGRLYVVFESDRGLVLMDQHAAHERVLFEQMLRRLEQGTAPSQRLLLPETIELSVRDAQFLREQLSTLNRLGVGLSEFGERTFLLDALPPFVRVPDCRRFILELVDELKAAGQQINTLRLGEQTIAKTVCRHAVKANDPLTGRELENLVAELRQCAMPYTCPHGRPTLIELSFRELEKKFGRQQ
jgi:DNA mismatch repair protein MutL